MTVTEFSFDEEEKASSLADTSNVQVLPLPPTPVAPGAQVMVSSQVHFVCDLIALFIPVALSRSFMVDAMFVGIDLVFAQPGSVSAELFAWHCGHTADCDTCPPLMAECLKANPNAPRYLRSMQATQLIPGIQFSLQVSNCSEVGLTFQSTLLVRRAEPPRQARPLFASRANPWSRPR